MSEDRVLYVLDGSYYVFRAFYAIRHLTNSRGMPTNGLFAFTNMLLNVMRDRNPHYLAVAFDPPGATFRNELYAEYKANRSTPPDELKVQFPHFRRIVEALRIPVLEESGFEADDMIGTLVKSREREGLRVVILSGDKDLCQLLDDKTTMFDSMRGREFQVADVLERFQVPPSGVADVLGLAGDSSDNIPGVPGIGEKTAGALIAQFGDLENLLANIDSVSGKKRKENLREFAEQARLSRQLATIDVNVPIEVDLEKYALTPPDFDAFDALCAEFEFGRFPNMVRELFDVASREVAMTGAEEFDFRTVSDRAALDASIAAIRKAGIAAFDLETTSLEPLDAEIVGFALSWEENGGIYIPVAHTDLTAATQLDRLEVIEALRELLEDPDFPIVAQNANYELRVLRRYGVELRGIADDTMLSAYLIDPNRRRYSLDALAQHYLSHRTIAFSDVAGKGAQQKLFHEVSVEEATTYAAEDANVTLRLHRMLAPMVDELKMRSLLEEVEIPLCAVISRMEDVGITVDPSFLNDLSTEFAGRMAEIEAKIYEAAGSTFNIASPKQLRVILFETLGLPVIKKTKSGPSTDMSVLNALSDQHALPGLILDYRSLAKLKSTYVDALPRMIHHRTGRVHTDYQQAVAATGRLSSSNPNLQNIPIRTTEGRRIREAFVPREGWTLLSGDYSQIELRILAHMSADPVLIDAFVRGEDIHRRTAAEIFEIPPSEVSSDQRSAAKAINFGLIYGMGAHRLAGELDISRREAAAWIDRYFERLAGVKPFLDGLIEAATELGYAETMIGRRRPIPELQGGRGQARAYGERLAMNTPIQGSAADLIKIAMIRIDRRLRDEGMQTSMLLQVHDELVFEAPPDEVQAALELAKTEMEGVFDMRVPLRVDFHTGSNWALLK